MTKPFSDFDNAMRVRLAQFGEAGERSTNKSPKHLPQADGRNRNYWLEGRNTKQHWYTPRTVGYLAGYIDFLRRDEIPCDGIETSDGYVWLDKGVMCALFVGECVEFRRDVFVLTQKGRALIAPFVSPADYGAAT